MAGLRDAEVEGGGAGGSDEVWRADTFEVRARATQTSGVVVARLRRARIHLDLAELTAPAWRAVALERVDLVSAAASVQTRLRLPAHADP